MKKKIMVIEESLYEFSKRGRPIKKGEKTSKKAEIDTSDSWDEDEIEDEEEEEPKEEDENTEDINVDVSDMSDAEEITVDEDVFDDKLMQLLNNEVQLPEISRGVLKFRLKGDLEKVLFGVPMIKMPSQNAFVFKLDNKVMKKIFLKDIIIEESQKSKNNRAYTINE
jgi:hypothetical protein